MGRGSSGVGLGGGKSGAKQQQPSAITQEEQAALDRRAEKAAESDLNDFYTAAMDEAYDGYDTQGNKLSPAQMAINSLAGGGAFNDVPGPSFSSYVKGEFAYRGLGGANLSNVKQIAQQAASDFGSIANSVSTPGEKAFYRDMQTISNMIAKYYTE